MSAASPSAKAVSASDVVGRVEREIGLVNSMRAEAQRMLDEAAALELASREGAKRDLGDRMGEMAFELASTTPSSVPDPLPVAPAVAVPTSDASNLGISPAPSPAQIGEDAPQRIHGVEVPLGRLPEAEGIVAEAKAFSTQGRKANPYSSDRGKNAWRKSLFAAALRELSRPSPIEAEAAAPDRGVAAPVERPPQPPQEASTPPAVVEAAAAETGPARDPDPLADAVLVEEGSAETEGDRPEQRSADPSIAAAAVATDPDLPPGEVRPADPTRAEGYGPRHGGRLHGVSYPIVDRRSVGGMKLPKPDRLDEIVPRASAPVPLAATSPPRRSPNAPSGAGLRPPPFMRN